MEFIALEEENIVDSSEFEREFDFTHNFEEISDKNRDKVRRKCGEIFIDEDDLLNFLCTFCENSFEEIEKFFVHVKGVHNNESNCTTINQEDPLNLSDDDEFRDLKHEPNIQITTIDDAEVQLPEYDDEKSNTCFITNTYEHEKEVEIEDKSVFCEMDPTFCTYQEKALFKKENFLKKYTVKPICGTCGKQFASLRNLKRHKEEVNCILTMVKKPFACDTCSKSFLSERSLRRHQDNSKCGHNKRTDITNAIGSNVLNRNENDPKRSKIS